MRQVGSEGAHIFNSPIHELSNPAPNTNEAVNFVHVRTLSSSLGCGLHLSIPATASRGIICVDNARLTLVCLRECISTLLAHSLHLAHLSNSLLELLHSIKIVSKQDATDEVTGKATYLGL